MVLRLDATRSSAGARSQRCAVVRGTDAEPISWTLAVLSVETAVSALLARNY